MKKVSFYISLLSFLALIFIRGVVYSEDTIKFGTTYGMTGRMGWIGGDCVDGAKLIIDETNAKGGIKGRKIELIVYDSKFDPETARTNIEKLIKKDKVVAILGPVSVQEAHTALPLAQKYKILITVGSAGFDINETILPQYKKEGKKCYMWALSIGFVGQNKLDILWLKKKGYKNLANIEPLDQMGDFSTKIYDKFCREFGLNVVAKERFDDKGIDFIPQMTKIKAANADCIGGMASGSPAVTLVKNRDQVGMKNVPFMIADGNLSKKFIELLGENTSNVYTVGPKIEVASYLQESDPQKKVVLEFQKKFKEKYNREPRGWFLASIGADTALMYVKAAEAVGTSGEKMRDWLEKQTRFEGGQATYSWSDLDHRGIGLQECMVLRIEGDKWVPAD
jgi:branched-chain amino acid transport system substrate-binding protein